MAAFRLLAVIPPSQVADRTVPKPAYQTTRKWTPNVLDVMPPGGGEAVTVENVVPS